MKSVITLVSILAVYPGISRHAFAQRHQDHSALPERVVETYRPQKPGEDTPRDPMVYAPIDFSQQIDGNDWLSNEYDLPYRLPYDLSQLELSGIYCREEQGNLAIFKIGDSYEWFPEGTGFRDADLLEVTETAAVFRFYSSDEDLVIERVVKELPH